jgi:UDP-N-acetylmuramate dehydrogenase
MQVQQNYPLKKYNTFGIDVYAKYFAKFSSVDDLNKVAAQYQQLPALILGGGSNILFTKNFDGLVLKNNIKGITTIHEDEDHIYVKAGAGEITILQALKIFL